MTKAAFVSLFDSHLLNGDNSFALKHLTISVKKFSHFEAFLDLHGTTYLMHLNWLKIVPALHCGNYPQFMTHTISTVVDKSLQRYFIHCNFPLDLMFLNAKKHLCDRRFGSLYNDAVLFIIVANCLF